MASESSAFEIKPMDQFIITPLFSEGDLEWYTFTNQSLWMLISLLGIVVSYSIYFATKRMNLLLEKTRVTNLLDWN